MSLKQVVPSKFREADLIRHRAVLRVILLIAIPCSLLFAILNFSRGRIVLPTSELAIFFLSVYLFYLSYRTRHIQKLTIGFTLIIVAVIISDVAFSPSSLTMIAWLYVMPILAYSSMGKKYGLLFSAVFFTGYSALVFYKFHDALAQYHYAQQLNLIVCGVLVWALAHVYEIARDEAQSMIFDLANTDSLTGVNNRMGLEHAFEQKKSTAKHGSKRIGVIILDLDLFKLINDTRGHPCGDKVLQSVAQALKNSLREGDEVYRLGGEEFVLLLNHCDERSLAQLAEIIRSRIENLQVDFEGEIVQVTCSIGAVLDKHTDCTLEEILAEADKLLYKAKQSGRNQVVLHS